MTRRLTDEQITQLVRAEQYVEPEPENPPGVLFHLIDDVAVDASQNDIPWFVPDLLYYRGAFLVAGAPKIGKSTMLADLVRARHGNAAWAGYEVKQGPTLLLTEEGPMPTAWRWHRASGMTVGFRYEWLEQWAEDRRTSVRPGMPAHIIDEAWSFTGWVTRRVREWCAAERELDNRPPLVIVDTLAVWGGMEDENDASQATKAISLWTRIAQDTGACVILVHHMRKSGGSGGEGIRGSSAILGTADGSWEVTRPTDSPTATRRKVSVLSRMAFPTSLTLDYDPDDGMYSPVDDRAVADSSPHLDIFLGRDEPLSVKDAAGLWSVSPTTATNRLTAMHKAGTLVREEVTHNHAKAYVYRLPRQSSGKPSGTFREVFANDD